MPEPISIRTFADLQAHSYRVHANCWRCRRFVVVDLAALGRDRETFVQRRWRCTVCGELGGAVFEPPSRPR